MLPEPSQRRLKAEDLFRLRLISAAQIAPDGSRVCYVQTIFVPEENRYRSNLWMVPAEGGEARKVTAVKGVAGHPVWAPDSRRIACTVMLDEKGLQPEEEEPEKLPPRERYTEDVRRITTLPYNLNGVGLIGHRFAQVVVIERTGTEPPRVLTTGRIDHAQPAWSPDGRYLAFLSFQHEPGRTPGGRMPCRPGHPERRLSAGGGERPPRGAADGGQPRVHPGSGPGRARALHLPVRRRGG